ncbi:iron-containing redox enzyme family protein [Polymorphospora sp. NPDC051019]|uniref:iron-containing redox enzyme family protein n=1 Tax=Polymorphospora sp. NPDC051019 TaxID=3155725 RepID=UPI003421FC36
MSAETFERYEAELAGHRAAFAADEAVNLLMSPSCDERLLVRWMLRYSVHGVAMTAPVESWIAGAGERCAQLGNEALGKALKAHARAEAGHDQMMVDDARAIAARLNAEAPGTVDVEALLAEPALASTVPYIELHERVIAGPNPQGQLAIEYEIEQLSVTMAPHILRNCERVFGGDPSFYSFLAEHVELDAGHTAFNRRQLQGVLAESPEALPTMIEAGRTALACYGAFMAECLRLAQEDLGKVPVSA